MQNYNPEITLQKQKIIRSFNLGASQYEQAADVQHVASKELARKIQGIKAKQVWEVGCGTGLLSQYIIQQFPDSYIWLTDIANEMLTSCEQRFAGKANITCSCFDIENFPSKDYPLAKFDLIISSMVLHWVSDLATCLNLLYDKLAPGGQLIFAILGENSLKEWRALCSSFKLPIATLLFPGQALLKDIFPDIILDVNNYQKNYSGAYSFIRTLKRIGAVASRPGYYPVSPGSLRRVFRNANNNFPITYEVIYGRIEKQ